MNYRQLDIPPICLVFLKFYVGEILQHIVQGVALDGAAAHAANHIHKLLGRQCGVLFFGASHAVNLRRVVNRAVQIVHAEREGELGGRATNHRPIGFDVVEIVEVNTANGVVAQVFHRRAFGDVAHLVVLIAEFEWDKSLKASGFVLQLAQPFEVVNAMMKLFNMAVEHRSVGAHSEFVPDFMEAQPLVGVAFVGGDLLSDFRVKNLRATAGQAVYARFFYQLHAFFVTHFRFFENVVVLHRREGFDVEFGAVLFYFMKKFKIKRQIVLWQNTPDDVNFRDWLTVVFAHDVEHFVHAECPGVRVIALLNEARVGAKFAVIDAQIRRLYVEVAVEKSVVAVLFFPDKIGECADVRKSAVFKEKNTFVEVNALIISNFLGG